MVYHSPYDNVRAAWKKIRGKSTDKYTVEAVLESPKHMDDAKLIDRLERYQHVVARRMGGYPKIEFENNRILEIGSGPLLGWGPVAVFQGCTAYYCVDPQFSEEVISAESIRDRYFLPLYHQLQAYYGSDQSFASFIRAVRERIHPLSETLESSDLRDAGPFDVVLSNSALEHVQSTDRFFGELSELVGAHTRQFHAVDFGNHKPTGNPFEGLYTAPKDERTAGRRSDLINMLRPSEVAELFATRGIRVEVIPYIVWEQSNLGGQVHPYWLEYSPADLFTKVAFFVDRVDRV